jgi:hypothetical protein
VPDVDLFASNVNTKCSKYVSWFRDPDSIAVDAFTISWNNIFFYAFPPFSMILKSLRKIVEYKAEGILVVPLWPTQAWFPLFLELLKGDVIKFNPRENLLTSSCRMSHPLAKTLTLVAGRLSGRLSN